MLTTLLLALLGCERPTTPAAPTHPNILFVSLDTTRADALSPFGGPPDGTPTAARIAREGAIFPQTYTVTPLTIPAHSSMFTGVVPPRHGVRDNGDYFLGPDVTTLAERMKAAGYATMASVGAEVTSHHWGFAQGFDAYFDDMGAQGDGNRWRVERPGAEVLADATAWLQGHPDEPWFAWVHLFDAHHPYTPPKEFAARFPKRPYLGEVAYVDHLVGTLLDTLGPTLDHTWVIVIGDHGEGLGGHGEAMHGLQLYNGTTHVPFMIRPPDGLALGKRLDFPASVVDITPTVLGAAGITIPEGLDGKDLTPWVTGAPEDPKRVVYIESLYGWHHYGFAPQRGIFDGRNKLIDNFRPELYRADDEGEREDVAPIRGPRVAELQGALDLWASRMKPIEGAGSRAQLDPDQIAQLQALGYVSSSDADDGPTPFRQDLPDPSRHQELMAEIGKARQALQRHDLDQAEAMVRAILARNAGLSSPQILLASILQRKGQPDEAIQVLTQADQDHPSSDTKASLGVAYLQKGDIQHAIALFQAALEVDPYLGRAWVPLIHARLISGDLPALERDTEAAYEKLPEVAGIYGMKGLLLAMSGDLEPAEPLIRRAVEADSHLPFMQHGMCTLLRLKNDLAGAEPHCLAEIDNFPPALPSRRVLVEIYASQHRYAEQLEQLSVLQQREPPNVLSAHSLAQCLFNLQRYDDALQAARVCEQLDPTYPHCKLLEANALKKLGQEDAASAAWDEAQKLKQSWHPSAPQ